MRIIAVNTIQKLSHVPRLHVRTSILSAYEGLTVTLYIIAGMFDLVISLLIFI